MGHDVEVGTCTDCTREVPPGARWCGWCGAALQLVDQEPEPVDDPGPESAPLAGEPSPVRTPAGDSTSSLAEVLVPTSDAATNAMYAPPLPPTPVVDKVGRETRRLAVAAVMIAVVGLGAVLGRGPTLGLHDIAPIGSGDGGGRDAARTGRVPGEAVSEPTEVVWSKPVRQQRLGDQNRWGALDGDLVTLYEDDSLQVLDRATGDLLWETNGHVNGRVFDHLLIEEPPTGVSLRDARTGEVRWRRVQNFGSSTFAVDGNIFEIVPNAMTSGLEGGEATTRLLDQFTGEIVWELPPANDAPGVESVLDVWFIAETWESSDPENWFRHQSVRSLIDGSVVLDLAPANLQDLGSDVGVETVVLLPLDRAMVVRQDSTEIFDLMTGTRVQELPHAQWKGLAGAGANVIVVLDEGEDSIQGVRVYDRASLELLWERGAVDWVEVGALRGGDSLDLLPLYIESRTVYVDPMTGEEVANLAPEEAYGSISIDATGQLQIGFDVRYESWDGATSWVLGEDAERVDAATLRMVDDRLIATVGTSWMIHDLAGNQTRVLDTRASGLPEGPYVGPAPMLGLGEGLLALSGKVARFSPSSRSVVWRWTSNMGELITAAVVGQDAIHVATDEVLRSLDPTDGATNEQRGYAGIRALTSAGSEALIALADPSRSDCAMTGPVGCDLVVTRIDPTSLVEEWTSASIEGVCAAATVGDDLIGVPTVGGVSFLDAANGRVVEVWSGPRDECEELAFDGVHWLVGTADGLLVGAPGATPDLIPTSGAVRTAPVIIADQVLVGLVSGEIVAIDLDAAEVAWSFALSAQMAASPVVHNGSIYVLLVSGELVRLA